MWEISQSQTASDILPFRSKSTHTHTQIDRNEFNVPRFFSFSIPVSEIFLWCLVELNAEKMHKHIRQ